MYSRIYRVTGRFGYQMRLITWLPPPYIIQKMQISITNAAEDEFEGDAGQAVGSSQMEGGDERKEIQRAGADLERTSDSESSDAPESLAEKNKKAAPRMQRWARLLIVGLLVAMPGIAFFAWLAFRLYLHAAFDAVFDRILAQSSSSKFDARQAVQTIGRVCGRENELGQRRKSLLLMPEDADPTTATAMMQEYTFLLGEERDDKNCTSPISGFPFASFKEMKLMLAFAALHPNTRLFETLLEAMSRSDKDVIVDRDVVRCIGKALRLDALAKASKPENVLARSPQQSKHFMERLLQRPQCLKMLIRAETMRDFLAAPIKGHFSTVYEHYLATVPSAQIDYSLIEEFIKSGLPLCPEEPGETPLHYAVQKAHLPLIEYLLQRHPEMSRVRTSYSQDEPFNLLWSQNPKHTVHLVTLFTQYDPECVQRPLSKGGPLLHSLVIRIDCLYRDECETTFIGKNTGCPPLADNEHRLVRMFAMLAKKTANVDARDNEGCSALHEAAYRNMPALIDILVGAKANIASAINSLEKHEMSLPMDAAWKRNRLARGLAYLRGKAPK